MASLDLVPDVEIDPEGKLRGTKDAEFHPDIFAKVEPALKAAGFNSEVQGGGKILHDSGKSMKVFSKSTGFGKADHNVTVKILKAAQMMTRIVLCSIFLLIHNQ